MDYLLIFARAILVILAAVLGIFGILGNFTDKETGKPNRRGYAALAIIIISAMLSIGLDWMESIQERNEARAVLRELNRNLHRIEDVGLEFIISFPMDHPSLAKYSQRVLPAIERMLSSTEPKQSEVTGPLTIPFISKSGLLPNFDFEPIAYTFLGHVCIKLEMFAESSEAEAFISVAGPSQNTGDLAFLLTRSVGPTGKNDVGLLVDFNRRKYGLTGWNAKTGPPQKSTGKLISLLDLAGATAVMYLCPKSYKDDTHRIQIESLTKEVQIDILGLNISGGRKMFLKWERHFNKYGDPVFVSKFPENFEEVLGLVQ
jgi:hypothetical protein